MRVRPIETEPRRDNSAGAGDLDPVLPRHALLPAGSGLRRHARHAKVDKAAGRVNIKLLAIVSMPDPGHRFYA